MSEKEEEVVVRVEIRKNATGEIREFETTLLFDDFGGDKYPNYFIWEEGNYSCDCNRRLFFARANCEEEDWQSGCGDTEYSVSILLEDGECIYSEFE